MNKLINRFKINFGYFDMDNTGEIKNEELIEVFENIGMELTKEQL